MMRFVFLLLGSSQAKTRYKFCLWGARRLALAMARHARLGAQSALGSLDAELIARIAEM